MKRTIAGLALVISGLAATAAVADTDLVAYPTDYKAKQVLYATVNNENAQRGNTVRDLYVTPEALAAIKAGRPLPSGTVITMEVYRAKQNEAKEYLKDAGGLFVKDQMTAVMVMEKRAGWGNDYPENIRNGEWEYGRFEVNGTRHADKNMQPCFTCHKPKSDTEYLFSMPQLQARARQ